MLIDLTPEFLAATQAPDPLDAYRRYLDAHRPVLNAYWLNYILDPESPQAEDIMVRTLQAKRP